jgi:hypothetical protein
MYLTENLIKHPFSKNEQNIWERMYRSWHAEEGTHTRLIDPSIIVKLAPTA